MEGKYSSLRGGSYALGVRVGRYWASVRSRCVEIELDVANWRAGAENGTRDRVAFDGEGFGEDEVAPLDLGVEFGLRVR